ncbi:MAG TPA: LuxR C-terminal-related transcriptional regulator [Rhodanobacteraceae bacterium]|nr:LuxR C-terminal-related transcriptional regulator [Rhodanobacteraceae bacterium]
MPPDRRRLDSTALWNTLAGLPAADYDAALRHLMAVLCAALRADNATWVAAVRMARGHAARRDGQLGWRGRAVRQLHATPQRDALVREALRGQDSGPALTTQALMRTAGSFRVHRLRDGFVDLEAFRATAHYRAFHQAVGLRDRLWAVLPVNADCESCLLFDTYAPRRRFSTRDAQTVADTLAGSVWFHRRLLLSHGLLLADKPLSPSQHKLLRLLLSERSEAGIARELGLTRATTHTYITGLYRHLGINSRAGLMALWLQN